MPQNSTSTKPPAVKAAVLAKYEEGKSKAQIARELGIDRETVTRILNEFKEAVEASIPAAVLAVKRRLEKDDGNFALRFLKAMGALGGTPQNATAARPKSLRRVPDNL